MSNAVIANIRLLFPGVITAVIVALSAKFLAEHYDTPAMLLALLLGIAVSFLGEEGKTVPGVVFCSKTILRIGVALLGARISAGLLVELGWEMIALVMAAVILTILFGFMLSRIMKHSWSFALLTAGSVAICGASAAVAISAILPKDEHSEKRLIFTVIGVTVLSTIAMVLYPIIVSWLALSPSAAGVFLGGTIHDVAQVVGAGFSVSEAVGEKATLVKLFRVAMLAPVVFVAALLVRKYATIEDGEARPALLPGFVVGFLVLATLNSFGVIPSVVSGFLIQLSRWLLLIAIAAVGMKSNLKNVLSVGGSAIALIVIETIFIGVFILGGLMLIGA